MNYIISLSDKKNSFSPEKIIRLSDVTEEFAKGYREALIIEKSNFNVYLENID